jgi:hypothetical protein
MSQPPQPGSARGVTEPEAPGSGIAVQSLKDLFGGESLSATGFRDGFGQLRLQFRRDLEGLVGFTGEDRDNRALGEGIPFDDDFSADNGSGGELQRGDSTPRPSWGQPFRLSSTPSLKLAILSPEWPLPGSERLVWPPSDGEVEDIDPGKYSGQDGPQDRTIALPRADHGDRGSEPEAGLSGALSLRVDESEEHPGCLSMGAR